MSSQEAQERTLYADLWSSLPAYAEHAPGEHHVPLFLEMSGVRPEHGPSVLDAGCGSGKGAVALAQAGLRVTMMDLTDAGLTEEARELRVFESVCLWHPLPTRRVGFSFAYCCDVLEHVPTEYTMLVIARLLEAVDVGVFFSISLVPDQFGAWVGQSLHRTVQSFTWWRDRMAELGTVLECRDLLHTGVYFVAPRRIA